MGDTFLANQIESIFCLHTPVRVSVGRDMALYKVAGCILLFLGPVCWVVLQVAVLELAGVRELGGVFL